MSITFSVAGQHTDFDNPEEYLNLSNTNAFAFLDWLGIKVDDYGGYLDPTEVIAAINRRQWPEERNQDKGEPPSESRGAKGCRFIDMGREEGYFNKRADQLKALAERAIRLDSLLVFG